MEESTVLAEPEEVEEYDPEGPLDNICPLLSMVNELPTQCGGSRCKWWVGGTIGGCAVTWLGRWAESNFTTNP